MGGSTNDYHGEREHDLESGVVAVLGRCVPVEKLADFNHLYPRQSAPDSWYVAAGRTEMVAINLQDYQALAFQLTGKRRPRSIMRCLRFLAQMSVHVLLPFVEHVRPVTSEKPPGIGEAAPPGLRSLKDATLRLSDAACVRVCYAHSCVRTCMRCAFLYAYLYAICYVHFCGNRPSLLLLAQWVVITPRSMCRVCARASEQAGMRDGAGRVGVALARACPSACLTCADGTFV